MSDIDFNIMFPDPETLVTYINAGNPLNIIDRVSDTLLIYVCTEVLQSDNNKWSDVAMKMLQYTPEQINLGYANSEGITALILVSGVDNDIALKILEYSDVEINLNSVEKKSLIEKYPQLEKYIKKFIGSQEFIRGVFKYCLWFKNVKIDDEILQIPEIAKKINIIKNARLASKDGSLNALATRPHQFRDLNETLTNSILIPIVSSEKREYIPIGFLDKNSIISDSALAIYDAEPWIFAVLTSKIHMLWVRAVGGKLETRIRYSAEICYNTFPFPDISEKQKQNLTNYVYNVLAERERHSEKTMAEIYDPNKMPAGLKKAHQELDFAIELCYRSRPFLSDEERLEHLFKLYEEMTNE